MSTKAKIQKVRSEVEAHEHRGWLKGYEEGLANREEEVRTLYAALEARNARIRELSHQKNGPKTAREALDLAWELAHPVKEGQLVPAGTRCIQIPNGNPVPFTTGFRREKDEWDVKNIRTLDPIPDREPDWLDAPAVLAHTDDRPDLRTVWVRREDDPRFWEGFGAVFSVPPTDLRDVTPLYPKETNE